MSIRVGTTNGVQVKRIRRNKNGTVRVQPVSKTHNGLLAHTGDQFDVAFKDFKPHKL